MTHAEIQERLSEYRDGELDPADLGEARAHIESCAACRAELQAWRRISKALFAPAPIRESEAFVQGVLRRVRDEADREEPAGSLSAWSPVLGLAVAAALAMLAAPATEPAVSPEDLLVADAPGEAPASMTGPREDPSDGDLLGLEEP